MKIANYINNVKEKHAYNYYNIERLSVRVVLVTLHQSNLPGGIFHGCHKILKMLLTIINKNRKKYEIILARCTKKIKFFASECFENAQFRAWVNKLHCN